MSSAYSVMRLVGCAQGMVQESSRTICDSATATVSQNHSASCFVSQASDVTQKDCAPTFSQAVCASGVFSTQHGLVNVNFLRILTANGSSGVVFIGMQAIANKRIVRQGWGGNASLRRVRTFHD